jgi:hypothetical protein
MSFILSNSERIALTDAAARERRVRRWRRYQVKLLIEDGKRPEEAATSVGCSRASVSVWLAAWRERGLAGLQEAPHPPPTPAHTARGRRCRARGSRTTRDHATDGTVPLLHGAARTAGIHVRAHTVRQPPHRLARDYERLPEVWVVLHLVAFVILTAQRPIALNRA